MGRFLIRRVRSGYTFHLKAGNGAVIATSEVYVTESACRKGIASVMKNAATTVVLDLTLPDPPRLPNPKFELYTDKIGAFRFRLKARNGEVIAVSEGYRTKQSCQIGIVSVQKNAPHAIITDP
jgi:uncharacterized protein YegP (UPF0339 family)